MYVHKNTHTKSKNVQESYIQDIYETARKSLYIHIHFLLLKVCTDASEQVVEKEIKYS